MSYDKQSFLESVAEGRKRRGQGQMNSLLAAQAVAPVMEQLTGDPNWNRYLQHLEHFKQQGIAAKTRAEAKQRDPMIWDHESMSKLKADIIAAEAMIEAFALCMELPKLLIENAELAKQNLARFETGNDKTP